MQCPEGRLESRNAGGVVHRHSQLLLRALSKVLSALMNHLRTPQLLGATPTAAGVRFCVWAPAAKTVEAVFGGAHTPLPLEPDGNGYFVAETAAHGVGALYRYKVDGAGPYPDPCSRFQPEGVHGASLVVDDTDFRWSDEGWPGIEMKGQVIYELHIGTFTAEGTFDAALEQLDELKTLGITLIEVMPIAEFAGTRNWGYDGVQLYAPFHGYGDYDAFKRFVDAAHRRGLGVILDVVYNHLGPDGNYLPFFSPHYFTDRYKNDWGEALNFDGPDAGPVREFILGNVRHWIDAFHLDGLRLDATQAIFDVGTPHIIAEIVRAARHSAGSRKVVVVAENEPQHSQALLAESGGGFGLDGLWNDDFHHSARVALTGRREAYFSDYLGRPQEFISTVKRGFLFQGQRYQWQKQGRGQPVRAQPACSFINFLQNHDQVANTFYGQRLPHVASAGSIRALTALLLLAPQTPLLFMGQEYGARTLFTFFADHKPQLRAAIHAGRREFLAQFPGYATAAAQAAIPDPADPATFAASKLDPGERQRHSQIYDLHRDLLRLRREDIAIAAQDRTSIDGAVLSSRAFVLRWFGGAAGDRLLVINLGRQHQLRPAPEPLLAPLQGGRWTMKWSSEDPRYGGSGAVMPCDARGWLLQGVSAVLLTSE